MRHKFGMLQRIGDIDSVLRMFSDSKKSMTIGSCASPKLAFGAKNMFCARAAGSVTHMGVRWGAGMVTCNHLPTANQAQEYGGGRCFGR